MSEHTSPIRTIGFVGWSGSGKTTLVIRLLPELIGRGLRVSTMKHTHHDFDIDSPGKDSYRHRQAGAHEVMLTSSSRWILMHELRGPPEPDMDRLLGLMGAVDLILIEGFKDHRHPKIEVHRPAFGKSLLCHGDPGVVAVASDRSLGGLQPPVLDLNDIPAVADFIVGHCGLTTEAGDGHE